MQIAPQAVWRWKIAAYLFLAGTGAGAFIVGVLADLAGYALPARIAITTGIPIVIISTIFLIWDLGHPEKFFTAILHPGTSWISRGFFILSILIAVGIVTIALWVWPLNLLDANPGLRLTLELIGLAFAIATCIYTGILIGIVVSRPFWNSPLLPILFLISAISTGIAAVFFVTPIWVSVAGITDLKSIASFTTMLGQIDAALIILEAIAVYLYLAVVFDRAPEAARLLIRGQLAGRFWGGFVIVGLLIPLVIEYLTLTLADPATKMLAALVAGVLILFGGFALRALILAAGIRSPLYVRVAFRVRPGV